MAHTSGSAFVKKSRKRSALQQGGDIFIAPQSASPQSLYLPEEPQAPSHSSQQPHHHGSPASTTVRPVVKHAMTFGEKFKFMAIRTSGNFLLLLCLYGVFATFGPTLMYEVQFKISEARGITYKVKDPAPSGFPSFSGPSQTSAPGFGDVLAGATEQVLVPPDTRFSIVIPKIGATAKVLPNVDPLNEKDFLPKLKEGVAHARGSVFPGMQGNVYLFAHSTDNFWNVGQYNAVFYLLKELKPGDPIAVYFENRKYNYKVQGSVVKDPSDVDFLIHSQIPGKEQLILQTCWPPGTTWKRLFVIATPEKQ